MLYLCRGVLWEMLRGGTSTRRAVLLKPGEGVPEYAPGQHCVFRIAQGVEDGLEKTKRRAWQTRHGRMCHDSTFIGFAASGFKVDCHC